MVAALPRKRRLQQITLVAMVTEKHNNQRRKKGEIISQAKLTSILNSPPQNQFHGNTAYKNVETKTSISQFNVIQSFTNKLLPRKQAHKHTHKIAEILN